MTASAQDFAPRLWMWFGQVDGEPATLLMVLVDQQPLPAYRPLIAGTLDQANQLTPIAEAAAADQGLTATLREYELVAVQDLRPDGAAR